MAFLASDRKTPAAKSLYRYIFLDDDILNWRLWVLSFFGLGGRWAGKGVRVYCRRGGGYILTISYFLLLLSIRRVLGHNQNWPSIGVRSFDWSIKIQYFKQVGKLCLLSRSQPMRQDTNSPNQWSALSGSGWTLPPSVSSYCSYFYGSVFFALVLYSLTCLAVKL